MRIFVFNHVPSILLREAFGVATQLSIQHMAFEEFIPFIKEAEYTQADLSCLEEYYVKQQLDTLVSDVAFVHNKPQDLYSLTSEDVIVVLDFEASYVCRGLLSTSIFSSKPLQLAVVAEG